MDQIKWSSGVKYIKSNKDDKFMYVSLNKKELVNNKINERELIQNSCKNPFFKSEDYVQHLTNQEIFLMSKKNN